MHCVDGARSGRLEQVLTRGEEERETLPLADTRKLRNKRIKGYAAGTGASELGVNPRPADAVTLRGSRGLPRQLAWPRHLCKWRAPEMLVSRYMTKGPRFWCFEPERPGHALNEPGEYALFRREIAFARGKRLSEDAKRSVLLLEAACDAGRDRRQGSDHSGSDFQS